MRIAVRNSCDDFNSYRAARVKSLFNVESGANFALDADLPLEDMDWRLGVVVGPSGSGKTSIGRLVFGDAGAIWAPEWPDGAPIIDAIAPTGDFDAVATALSAVGLGNVPAWLRPHAALSNGERFRADMARLVAEAPARAVVDEFTSMVDRQIARIGAAAFARAWRRTGGRAVLLTPHRDVLEWLEPCWVFDTAERRFARGCLQRPEIAVEIRATDWRYWPRFEPHHYLKLPRMVAASCYVGAVDGEPVTHCAVSTQSGMRQARMARIVVMPEWQGVGVGLRFITEVAALWLAGANRYEKPMATVIATSHPGLARALKRASGWVRIGGRLHGTRGASSHETIVKASAGKTWGGGGNYGCHFRALRSFKYVGAAAGA